MLSGLRAACVQFRGEFGFEQRGHLARFLHESLRFGGGGDGAFHFGAGRAGEFAEGVGGQIGVVEVHGHDWVRGVKGRKSREAPA